MLGLRLLDSYVIDMYTDFCYLLNIIFYLLLLIIYLWLLLNHYYQMDLHIAAYNMHGWSNSKSYLNRLSLTNYILFISEHWLFPDILSNLSSCNDQFSSV